MNMWIWIIIFIIIIALFCYTLNRLIDNNIDEMVDSIEAKQAREKIRRPLVTIGRTRYSEMYIPEDDEIQLPLNDFKYLTIWGNGKNQDFRLEWASSILERNYQRPLPNNLSLEFHTDTVSVPIDIVMAEHERKVLKQTRKYEQVFLTVRDGNGSLLKHYKIVLYYDYDLYIRNNPSFA